MATTGGITLGGWSGAQSRMLLDEGSSLSRLGMRPTVSVVIPVFNAEAYLLDCLESVSTQSYDALEIIVVNDGSTDRSVEILADYADRDARILVLHQQNQGVSAARNAGLDAASGKLVTFVDADDRLESGAIVAWVGAMAPGVDLVIEGDSNPSRTTRATEFADLLPWGLRSSVLNPPWGKLYRVSVVESERLRFETGISLGEDLLFNLEYLRLATAVRTLPGRRYSNRIVLGSLTRSYRETKYRDLAFVHSRIRTVTEPFRTERLDSLLAYLRIKSLISCTTSDLASTSPLTRAEARQRSELWNAENPGLRVVSGDLVMRILGTLYRFLGLWRTAQLVTVAKAVDKVRRREGIG